MDQMSDKLTYALLPYQQFKLYLDIVEKKQTETDLRAVLAFGWIPTNC